MWGSSGAGSGADQPAGFLLPGRVQPAITTRATDNGTWSANVDIAQSPLPLRPCPIEVTILTVSAPVANPHL